MKTSDHMTSLDQSSSPSKSSFINSFINSDLPFVEAKAPANIAFIKYWGKSSVKDQWPANDSLSMTLANSVSTTRVQKSFQDKDEFCFEDTIIKSTDYPDHKVIKHIERLRVATGQSHFFVRVLSRNNFPAACGIASSASGYAALTVGLVALFTGAKNWQELELAGFSKARLSCLARMGSGSAGRSIYGGFVSWQKNSTPDEQVIQPFFGQEHWTLSDLVVVINASEKPTSSSDAHTAAWHSPLYAPRLAGIDSRLSRTKEAIKAKDLSTLGQLLEDEALEMHAVAMTGEPRVNYFCEDTSRFLTWVREKRRGGDFNAWFTIDAGPNVHLITESQNKDSILRQIKADWPNLSVIQDQIGSGPSFYAQGKSL
jgi:diphosphomevalonate decarboxylase